MHGTLSALWQIHMAWCHMSIHEPCTFPYCCVLSIDMTLNPDLGEASCVSQQPVVEGLQARLAPCAVSHRVLMLHPHNTRQHNRQHKAAQ